MSNQHLSGNTRDKKNSPLNELGGKVRLFFLGTLK
jgi:hypothetical protein